MKLFCMSLLPYCYAQNDCISILLSPLLSPLSTLPLPHPCTPQPPMQVDHASPPGAPTPVLLEDLFRITAVDAGGKMFEKVSRVEARGQAHALSLVVDLNTDLYPVRQGESYTIALARTVEYDSTEPSGRWDPTVYHRPTLMDHYDYVMFGRVYGCSTEETTAADATVYVSYGGLLMKLQGTARDLREIKYNQQLYFLMKRVQRS